MSEPAGAAVAAGILFYPGRACAAALDAADPLAPFRRQFHFPQAAGRDAVYLLGNSLGLQPVTAANAVQDILADWQDLGIEGYFKGRAPWLTYNERAAALYAPLLGAKPAEIAAMNTLSVNLHLMMVSFYRPAGARTKIMIEKNAFPSDQYAVKSQIAFHGRDPAECLIELAPRPGEKALRTDDILAQIEARGAQTALILIGGVNYYTGQLFDMAAIAAAGRAQGCVVGFDLAHAIGNVPLSLHDWDVDFACWCAYKYLNGGPAAIGGVFVHERYADRPDLPRFAGWWGHEKETRFLMGPDFIPSRGAAGWQLSNTPVLSLAPVIASLELFATAGMDALREKSLRLTGYLEYLLNGLPGDHFTIMTPRDPAARGCQLSLAVKGGDGRRIHKALTDAGVYCDWREPDCIRAAPVPLYNSFGDVYVFVEILAEILSQPRG